MRVAIAGVDELDQGGEEVLGVVPAGVEALVVGPVQGALAREPLDVV